MPLTIPQDLLEAYSQGRLTRREVADRLGTSVGFGDLLDALHRHGLPLPRIPADPGSPGVSLIRDLASRTARAG